MPRRVGQSTLSTHVDRGVADRFNAWARRTDGGASAALRRLITAALEEADGLHGARSQGLRGVGRGRQVSVRFRDAERAALAAAAEGAGMTPANWVRSLALVHLTRTPQWNSAELDALRALAREVRAIGNNVNQIAHQANAAALAGLHPPGLAREAYDAAELIRAEMRRLVAIITGNFEYWGLPDREQPALVTGDGARADGKVRANAKPRRRPRRQGAK